MIYLPKQFKDLNTSLYIPNYLGNNIIIKYIIL